MPRNIGLLFLYVRCYLVIEVFKTTLNLEELKAKREKFNARNFEIQLLGGSIGKSDKLIEGLVCVLRY